MKKKPQQYFSCESIPEASRLLLSVDPLDPFTEEGQILGQLDHGNDSKPSYHHTSWPKEGVEQHVGAVEFG